MPPGMLRRLAPHQARAYVGSNSELTFCSRLLANFEGARGVTLTRKRLLKPEASIQEWRALRFNELRHLCWNPRRCDGVASQGQIPPTNTQCTMHKVEGIALR